jgi:hypothetical protein
MTGGARRSLIAVGRLALIGMALPEFRIGRVTTPTSLASSSASYSGVFGSGGHRGRLTADDPEDGEQGDYANSDGEKIEVFPIHKVGHA